MSVRLAAWQEISNNPIVFEYIDIAKEYDRLLHLIFRYKPDAIVHFAEQRAAPYSMKSPRCKRYTVDNNLNADFPVVCSGPGCVESDGFPWLER